MRKSDSSQTPRAGFTLIEIIIVILIIGILAALLLPAILGALSRAKLTQQIEELSRINLALESFKNKYGIYPPSRIRLRENTAYTTTDPFDVMSVTYLRKIWPNIRLPNGSTGGMGQPAPITIMWCKDNPNKTEATVLASSGTAGSPGGTSGCTYELEGDECLVFFLGGIAEFIGGTRTNPNSIVLHGFSTRPTNPGGVPDTTIAQTLQRTPSLHEFDAGRLVIRSGAQVDNNTTGYPSGNPSRTKYEQEFGSAGIGYQANPTTSKLPSYRSPITPANADAINVIAYFSSYEGHGYRPHDVNFAEVGNGLNYPADYPEFQFVYYAPIPPSDPAKNFASMAPNPYTETLPYPANNSMVRFYNAHSFQLILPGVDGYFGPGGQIPRTNTGDLARKGASYDNVTNISGSDQLGAFNEAKFTQ